MRVTTNSVLKNYRKSLSGSFSKLTDARNTVLSQRNFNSYAEDPASATQAFKLRRSYIRTGDQLHNTESIINKFNTAYQVLDNIADLSKEADNAVLRALNDPTSSGRNALGQSLSTMADNIIQLMNSKYGDSFVFAGNDGLNVPFAWGDSYRTDDSGVYLDVNYKPLVHPVEQQLTGAYLADLQTRDPEAYAEAQAFIADGGYTPDGNGDYLDGAGNPLVFTEKVKITDDYIAGLNDDAVRAEVNNIILQNGVPTRDVIYRNVDAADGDPSLLKHFTESEGSFMDIGMGLKDNELGELNELSAFNSSLCGLNFIGHGVDEDGDPKNLVSIIRELGEIFSRCDIDSGAFANDVDAEKATRLQLKLVDAMGDLTSSTTDLSTKAGFLNTNAEQLNDAAAILNEQIVNIEDCDLADAITTFSWAQYCYNAALKVGNSVLSQSLMDYMN